MASARATLKTELELLRSSLAKIDSALEAIRMETESDQRASDEAVSMIFQAFRGVKLRFDDAVVRSRSVYARQLIELQKQASIIQNVVDEAELLLSNEDFRAAAQVQQLIEKVADQIGNIEIAELPEQPPPVQNELLPPFETINICLEDFPALVERYRPLKKEELRFIHSDRQEMYGGLWRAKIYPCGNDHGFGTHLSIFLELVKGSKEPKDYTYRLAIIHNSDPARNVVREFSSHYRELDSWGWNKAIAIEELLGDLQILFGERLALKLELSVRPESYRVLFGLFNASYEKVKSKYDTLQKSIEQGQQAEE
jgi:hypothetical protein